MANLYLENSLSASSNCPRDCLLINKYPMATGSCAKARANRKVSADVLSIIPLDNVSDNPTVMAAANGHTTYNFSLSSSFLNLFGKDTIITPRMVKPTNSQ